MSNLAHVLFTSSLLGVTLFLYSIMRSDLQLRSPKFILYFSIGSTLIQWGSTSAVLWLELGEDFLHQLSPLTTSGLVVLSLMSYYYGYNKLRNIEDHYLKSIKLFRASAFISMAGVLIQIIFIGFSFSLMDQIYYPMVALTLTYTMIVFFLIMRIMQQLKIDQDELYVSRKLSFVIALFMALMTNTLVMAIVDMFSLLPNKIYLVVGFVCSFFLILFTVIYGEKQYDVKNVHLHFLAYHDQLTSLKNRIYLQRKLDEMVKLHEPFQLLFIDLDHFKQINDVHGHQVGDRVLKVIAERFREFPEITTMARIGGDEFTLITKLKTKQEVQELALNLTRTLAEPVSVDENRFQVTTSIGVSSFPTDGTTVDELMKKADLAMYRAKTAGRDMYWLFDDTLEKALTYETELKMDLIKALQNEEFILHYQPLIDLKTKRIKGFEALIRWNHPTKGMIQPLSFVKIAEDSGLIVPIGEWVLHEACQQMVEWNCRYQEAFMVSVNLSLKQFGKKNIYDVVSGTLSETGLAPHLLNLEITESTIMVDPDYTVETIQKLSKLGVKISIDDFGTGYSSLSYLKQFHIQSLKIDRSFIHDVTENAQDSAIVNAILSMADSLGLEVVAEGVEDSHQAQYLAQQHCQYAQGFLFSKPLSAEEMDTYIKNTVTPVQS